MDIKHVPGQDRGDVFLFALSTCVWCKRVKAFLEQLGLAYSYLDVDLVPPAEKEAALQNLSRWNPSQNFPTIVINKQVTIVGFQPDRIKEALGL